MTTSIKDTVERLAQYERVWGDEPSIPPFPDNSFGFTTGRVIGDMKEAIALIERLAGALEEIAYLSDLGSYADPKSMAYLHSVSGINTVARRALSGEPTP